MRRCYSDLFQAVPSGARVRFLVSCKPFPLRSGPPLFGGRPPASGEGLRLVLHFGHGKRQRIESCIEDLLRLRCRMAFMGKGASIPRRLRAIGNAKLQTRRLERGISAAHALGPRLVAGFRREHMDRDRQAASARCAARSRRRNSCPIRRLSGCDLTPQQLPTADSSRAHSGSSPKSVPLLADRLVRPGQGSSYGLPYRTECNTQDR